MNKISVLDCTLRDGGYCNEWRFGFDNAQRIVIGLQESGVEIIECGFVTNKIDYDPNVTKYPSLETVAKVIPEKRDGKIYVARLRCHFSRWHKSSIS